MILLTVAALSICLEVNRNKKNIEMRRRCANGCKVKLIVLLTIQTTQKLCLVIMLFLNFFLRNNFAEVILKHNFFLIFNTVSR